MIQKFCGVCFLLLGVLTGASAGDASADELAKSYDQWCARWKDCSFKVVSRQVTKRFTQAGGVQGSTQIEEVLEVIRRAQQWKQRGSRSVTVVGGGKKREQKLMTEWLSGAFGRLQLNLNDKNGKLEALSGSLESLASQSENSALARYTKITDGDIVGGTTLPELLRSSADTTTFNRVLGDQSLKVLEHTGDRGVHRVWLDPAKANQPMLIEQIRRGAELIRPDSPPPEKRSRPLADSSELSISASEFITVSGVPVASRYRLIQKGRDKDNRVIAEIEETLEFSDIRFPAPNDETFAPWTPIPEGTEVTISDQPGVAYEWRDGEIRKAIRAESVANVARKDFIPGSGFGTGFWVAVGLAGAAFVVAGVVALRRRRGAPA